MTPTINQPNPFIQKLIGMLQGTLPNAPSAEQQFQNIVSGGNFAAPTSNNQGLGFMQNIWNKLTGGGTPQQNNGYLQPIVDSYMKQKSLQELRSKKSGKKKQPVLEGDQD